MVLFVLTLSRLKGESNHNSMSFLLISYLDTKILAKSLQKKYGWENVKLTTLSEYFCIEQKEAHRAWCDAEANVYVYLRLKDGF